MKAGTATPPTLIPQHKHSADAYSNRIMVGYYYAGETTRLVGYNIFGGAIYNTTTKTNYTKKRKFIAPKMNEYGTSPKNSSNPAKIVRVCPIVKHGKYYYTHGGPVTKKLSDYRTWNIM